MCRVLSWRRKWHPTPVLLPGESHGQRSLVGYSPWGRKESETTERLNFLFFLSFIYFFSKHPSTAKSGVTRLTLQAQKWRLSQAHAHLWTPESASQAEKLARLEARPEKERLLGTRRHTTSPPSGLRSPHFVDLCKQLGE